MFNRREIISDITSRIDSLEVRYNVLADNGDLKGFSGLERCIEMLMRLHGIDVKSVLECDDSTDGDNLMINLSDLSTASLEELLSLTNRSSRELINK